MMFSNRFAFASSAFRSSVKAGKRELLSSITAATCIAVGNLERISAKGGLAPGKQDVRVVRTLAHVDMVVGVHWRFGAEFAAEDFDSAVGDDLL